MHLKQRDHCHRFIIVFITDKLFVGNSDKYENKIASLTPNVIPALRQTILLEVPWFSSVTLIRCRIGILKYTMATLSYVLPT